MADLPYSKEIKAYCERVVEILKPRAVILFGSMATGKYGLASDIDIVVVCENFPDNFLERLRALFELNSGTAPIQPFGYTPDEFLKMLRRRHPTALYAVADGKPLYDDGFFAEAKRVFERVKTELGLVRIDHGWEAKALTAALASSKTPI